MMTSAVSQKSERDLARGLGVQVDTDVALARVLLCIVAGHTLLGWMSKSGNIRPWRLDLDHLGAKI